MAQAAIAKRYARALLALGEGPGLDTLVEELKGFERALADSRELRTVLMTPGLPLEQRQGLLRDVLTRAGANKVTVNALLLLTERGRLGLLGPIIQAVRAEADRVAGRVRARVTSAAELAPAQVEAIRTTFEKQTGKRIVVETAVDADLIGGVVAEIGSTVYDGSIKSQLRRLRDALVRDTGAA